MSDITPKEAITILGNHISPHDECKADNEANQAIRLAIKALERPQDKHDRPKGKLMSLDLAKRVIAKFEGYLDDDMIARIQIALEKESEAENETDN